MRDSRFSLRGGSGDLVSRLIVEIAGVIMHFIVVTSILTTKFS